MRQNRQYLFNMSYLEVFGVLTRVGADVSKFCGVGAGVLKHGAGAESKKCDFAHLCPVSRVQGQTITPSSIPRQANRLQDRGETNAGQ